MKKLVLLLAVAFSVSMFSCGGGENANGCDSDSCKAAEATEAPAETPAPEATEATEAPAEGEEAAAPAEEAAAPAEEAPAEAAK